LLVAAGFINDDLVSVPGNLAFVCLIHDFVMSVDDIAVDNHMFCDVLALMLVLKTENVT
jgi:hypothetical protein